MYFVELEENHSLDLPTLDTTLMNKVRMDAIEEAQERFSDTREKLEFISQRILNSAEDLRPIIPVIQQNESAEEILEMCSNVRFPIMLAIEGITYQRIPRVGVNKSRKESFVEENENYGDKARELLEYRRIDRFMGDIKRMMYLLSQIEMDDPDVIMEKLLMLVDAALAKTAVFWKEWKHKVDDMVCHIPLKNCLSTILTADGELDALYGVCQRLLPEVVTTCYLTGYYAEYGCMNKCIYGDMASKRDELYVAGLMDLKNGTFWDADIPLEEQVGTFHARFTPSMTP